MKPYLTLQTGRAAFINNTDEVVQLQGTSVGDLRQNYYIRYIRHGTFIRFVVTLLRMLAQIAISIWHRTVLLP